MSVCIEQSTYQNNHNNFSQHLPAAKKVTNLSSTNFSKKTIFSVVNMWFARSRQRKQLANLDQNLLNDIGVTKAQAREEYSKPFWK